MIKKNLSTLLMNTLTLSVNENDGIILYDKNFGVAHAVFILMGLVHERDVDKI